MALGPGSRLGPYEISGPLGKGGMGEVFRARDTRLQRDVAMKALPPGFEADPERLARFQREARVLASLNHANVGAIYGFEESPDGHAYLILECIEGETLASRLAEGPLPLDETLRIAAEIAAGLGAAHDAGVIHRDLKPANVMLRADGTVKVLDFGLAKTAERGSASGDQSRSPTISLGTQTGFILGTAAYMSPEQARGRPLDKRTDIFSFGSVVYECLTGRRAFPGESVTDTLSAIVADEPDWAALPASTPLRLRDLLRRCLQKDPRRRLHDISDARLELEEVMAGASSPMETRPTAVLETGVIRRKPWRGLPRVRCSERPPSPRFCGTGGLRGPPRRRRNYRPFFRFRTASGFWAEDAPPSRSLPTARRSFSAGTNRAFRAFIAGASTGRKPWRSPVPRAA